MIKYPCSICSKSVKKNQKALLCTGCSQWVHIVCGRVLRETYDSDALFDHWQCPKCLLQQLPFWNDLDATLEFMANDTDCNDVMFDVNEDRSADINDFALNDIKGIKLAHLNVRSLVNKVADLQNWLSNNPYDLLGLSETWLTEDHSDSLFSIKGYKFERRDRRTHGGGVGCFISENSSYVRRLDLESDTLEIMWVELQRTNSSSLFIGILYRKPDNLSDFFDNLEHNLEKLYSVTNNVILLGDFNCNMLTDNNLSRKVLTLCTTMQMTQVISQPTRITPHSQSLIDLVCISDPLVDNIIKSGVQTAGLSDHSVIYTAIKGKYLPLSPNFVHSNTLIGINLKRM